MSETSVTKVWYVWLVASKEELGEALVGKMVRRGFAVAPLGRQLIVKHDDSPSVIIAFSLTRTPKNDAERKEYTALGIHSEVVNVVNVLKGKFWGCVVSLASDSTWYLGNMSIKEELAAGAEIGKKLN